MIEFQSVNFAYEKKGVQVLQDINFKIDKGEFVAIVGKNGVGKTTLIKHVNGLLKPLQGSVHINNENIVKKRLSEMASVVGLAFQNPNHQLFAETVQKELEFGPKNLGIKDEELSKLTLDIAKEFQITHLLEKNPLELSGGERRLVSIASVLTMNQQILVLDEPTFGQDYRQKKRLGLFLHSLTERGVTVLIVSHDIDFILDFAPRLIVLKDGTIIADGKTRDILSSKSLIEESDLDVPLLLELQEELKTITDEASKITDEASIFQFIMNLITKKEKRG